MTNPVLERIQGDVTENPVMLYMKGTAMFPQCGFSARVVQILTHLGVPFQIGQRAGGHGTARGRQAVLQLADDPAALRRRASSSAAATSSPRCSSRASWRRC